MMKRTLSAVLAMVLVALVAATFAAGCAKDTTTWGRVKKDGVMKVGVEGTYPPFNFLNDKNQMDGFDIDISNEIAKRLGIKAEFVGVEWKGMIGGLLADKFDIIIAQMSVTEERKQQVDFTDPYVITGAVLISRPGDTRFKKLGDIAGFKVGTGTATTFETLAKSVPGANLTTYTDFSEYVADLLNGRLDVIINDALLAGYAIKNNNLGIEITSPVLNQDVIGMAIKKNNQEFLDKLNTALADIMADGTYDTIYQKWFGAKPTW